MCGKWNKETVPTDLLTSMASMTKPQAHFLYILNTHYDVIMGMMASQITSLTIVYSIVYSDADKKKHQSSASLAFVRGIHRWPVNSPHKWPVTWKMFPFDDVIIHVYEWKCLNCDTDFTEVCSKGSIWQWNITFQYWQARYRILISTSGQNKWMQSLYIFQYCRKQYCLRFNHHMTNFIYVFPVLEIHSKPTRTIQHNEVETEWHTYCRQHFWNTCLGMKIIAFHLEFHWGLFIMVRFTISQP